MSIGITRYRFGVNYTPTRAWWYCWNDFSADAIAEDLDAIVGLGADHIRIMLIWPYFQPNPRVVSEVHLERLSTLMGLAGERQLDVCVSLFVGWLSGYALKPSYQEDETFYNLEKSRECHERYVTSVAEVANRHGNFLGFDLGNELNCCWHTEAFDSGDIWNKHMLSVAKRCAPRRVHVNGVDHNPWFRQATFSPRCLAETQSIIALHCWTFFTGALARAHGNCFDPRCVRLPEAMAALARSYAGDPRKPVWIQEYGMSEDWISKETIPRFLRESTLNAIESGASWFTWWSSHDLDRRYDFHPLEYSLGLISHEQKMKPEGYAFKEIANAYRGRDVAHTGRGDIPAPPPLLNVDSTWVWLEHWLEANKRAEQGGGTLRR